MELNDIITSVNDAVWGYVLIFVLVGCGLWFTFKTRFVQFRMVGEMVRLLTESAVDTVEAKVKETATGKKQKHISSFQAFAVSVATRVGTGNLAGVATAIAIGGQAAEGRSPLVNNYAEATEYGLTQQGGETAPDITLPDLNGKSLSLSSLRGKYVVLDFWGSWCIWCIRGIPKMKEYYEKYQGKFEILGIDCNDTEEAWRAAVEKHQLPWLHVYNAKDPKLLKEYGIRGFPTKIVVAPDGKIIKTVVGEDPAFYEYLDQLFK